MWGTSLFVRLFICSLVDFQCTLFPLSFGVVVCRPVEMRDSFLLA